MNRGIWFLPVAISLVLVAGVLSVDAAAAATDLEQPVCENDEVGWIARFRFQAHLWSWFWPSLPDVQDKKNLSLERFRITNPVDGRQLQVYKVVLKQPKNPGGRPTKLLFIQGNAMTAGQVIFHLEPFAQAGFEVYLMEFRGYGYRAGRSEGTAYLKAEVSDFRILADQLARDGTLSLYGVSFGGAVVMKLIGDGVPYERAVVDSTPSNLGCPIDFKCAQEFFLYPTYLQIAGEY